MKKTVKVIDLNLADPIVLQALRTDLKRIDILAQKAPASASAVTITAMPGAYFDSINYQVQWGAMQGSSFIPLTQSTTIGHECLPYPA